MRPYTFCSSLVPMAMKGASMNPRSKNSMASDVSSGSDTGSLNGTHADHGLKDWCAKIGTY